DRSLLPAPVAPSALLCRARPHARELSGKRGGRARFAGASHFSRALGRAAAGGHRSRRRFFAAAMTGAGIEWIVDAHGCRPERLADEAALRALTARIVGELDLRVLDERWHRFPAPGGVTGLLLLAESHLACHTYPEAGLATFNLYCCRERADWPW